MTTMDIVHDVRPLAGVRCIGYLRVSTERQAGTDKVSLTDQRAAIEKKAADLGLVVGSWFEDPGASGGSFEKRRGMSAMVASCEASSRPEKDAGVILVLTASRFGRPDDPEESAFWRFRFKRAGWAVRYCLNDDSTDKKTRHLMRAIGDVAATEERDEIKRRAISGARGAAEHGFWPGGTPPFGYVRKVVNAGQQRILGPGVRSADGEDVMLWPEDTTEAPLVRKWFELYAAGACGTLGLAAIAREDYAARNWTTSSMYRMLVNRVYVGDLLSGRRAQTGEQYGKLDAHPAIIGRALFARVQERLEQNARMGKAQRGEYILSGVVRCTTCDLPLIGSGTNGRGSSKYYRCRPSYDRRDGGCHRNAACVAAPRLEGAMRRLLAAEFRRTESKAAVRHAIDAALSAMATRDPAPSFDEIDRRVRQLETQRERLVKAVTAGTFTPEEAATQMGTLRAKLDAAKADRAGVISLQDRAAAAPIDRQSLDRLIDGLPAVLAELDGQEARAAMLPWIRSATFDKTTKRLTVEIRRVPAIGMLAPEVVDLCTRHPECSGKPPEAFVTRTAVLGQPKRSAGGA